MKKALLLVVVLLVTLVSNAQITKGKTLLGGTIAYSKGKAEYVNFNSDPPTVQRYVTISPSVGWVVKENVIVGVQGNFSSQKQEYANANSNSDYKAYGGGVFVRRYVPLLKSFYFFGQGAVAYSNTESSQENMGQTYNETKGWGLDASIYPGLAYAITRKFHVEAGLNDLLLIGYSHSESKTQYFGVPTIASSKGNAFGFSTSLGSNAGFNIGFRFLL